MVGEYDLLLKQSIWSNILYSSLRMYSRMVGEYEPGLLMVDIPRGFTEGFTGVYPGGFSTDHVAPQCGGFLPGAFKLDKNNKPRYSPRRG